MQEIILIILFVGAVFFMGRMFWKQYKAESGCATGCSSCEISEVSEKPELRIMKKP